jgi:hypothetical protein
VSALDEFGLPTQGIDIDELMVVPRVLMIGRAPTRIDLLTRPDGLVWEGAWSRRVETSYGAGAVALLAIEDLIASKRAAGRPRDLADVSMLEKIRGRK